MAKQLKLDSLLQPKLIRKVYRQTITSQKSSTLTFLAEECSRRLKEC